MSTVPVLIDFDGVIKLGEKPAIDAGKFLRYLCGNKIPAYILSNSTLKTSKDINKFLSDENTRYKTRSMSRSRL